MTSAAQDGTPQHRQRVLVVATPPWALGAGRHQPAGVAAGPLADGEPLADAPPGGGADEVGDVVEARGGVWARVGARAATVAGGPVGLGDGPIAVGPGEAVADQVHRPVESGQQPAQPGNVVVGPAAEPGVVVDPVLGVHRADAVVVEPVDRAAVAQDDIVDGAAVGLDALIGHGVTPPRAVRRGDPGPLAPGAHGPTVGRWSRPATPRPSPAAR